MKRFIGIFLITLAACRPPASDRYVERIALDDAARGPQVMLASPNTEGAVWAVSGGTERIVFGQPGKAPLLALECADAGRMLKVTRFAPTEPRARGMMALIGNGHVERLKINSLPAGENRGHLWQGRYDPADPRLDAMTGVRGLEVTIPGAGTLKLPASPRPSELIERCRRLGPPAATAAPEPALPPA